MISVMKCIFVIQVIVVEIASKEFLTLKDARSKIVILTNWELTYGDKNEDGKTGKYTLGIPTRVPTGMSNCLEYCSVDSKVKCQSDGSKCWPSIWNKYFRIQDAHNLEY